MSEARPAPLGPGSGGRFVVAGPCLTGDCDCRRYAGMDAERAPQPPLHQDCTCYVEWPGRPARLGFLYYREEGERLIGVVPLLWGRARLGLGRIDREDFDDVWDYPSVGRAIAEARIWDPDEEAEPQGWHRHPTSGRRREDGDPARERKDEP